MNEHTTASLYGVVKVTEPRAEVAATLFPAFPASPGLHGPHTAQIKRHAHELELGFCLLAFSIPSMPSWRKPRTFLIRPLGGSAIHLRFLSSFCPCWVCDLAAMATVAHKRG